MAEERPAAGSGSDPYAGGYAFGPYSGGPPTEQTGPAAWQSVGGRRVENEPAELSGWQAPETAEQTRPLPPWTPTESSAREASQAAGYDSTVGGPMGLPPRRSKRMVIMAAVLAAALVLVVVGVGIAVTSGPKPKASTSQSGATAPSGSAASAASQSPTPAPAALPSDAVRGYLEALASGNAARATSYAAQAPAERALLTNAVLAESKKRAPITAISVPTVDDQNATSVTASYAIGSTNVSASYPVVKLAEAWKLVSVTAAVAVDYSEAAGMKINGVGVHGSVIQLFPGSYAVTATSKNLTFGKRTFVVKAVGTNLEQHATPVTLTGAGKKRAVSAARDDLNRCLTTKAIAPKNCPFGVRSNGYTNVTSTIRWTVIGGDPFAEAKTRLEGGDVVVSSISVRVRFNSSCYRKGAPYLCSASINNVAEATVPLAHPGKVGWYAVKR